MAWLRRCDGRILVGCALLAALLPACRRAATAAPSPAPSTPGTPELAAVVAAHRQVLALLDEGNGLPGDDRPRAETVARVIFHENRQRLDRLGEAFATDPRAVAAALDYLER